MTTDDPRQEPHAGTSRFGAFQAEPGPAPSPQILAPPVPRQRALGPACREETPGLNVAVETPFTIARQGVPSLHLRAGRRSQRASRRVSIQRLPFEAINVCPEGREGACFSECRWKFKNGYGESVFPQGSACRISNCLRKALDFKFGLISLNRFRNNFGEITQYYLDLWQVYNKNRRLLTVLGALYTRDGGKKTIKLWYFVLLCCFGLKTQRINILLPESLINVANTKLNTSFWKRSIKASR